MKTPAPRTRLQRMTVVLALALVGGPVAAQTALQAGKATRAQGMAQQDRALQRDQGRKDGFTDEALYPKAQREAPGLRASGRTSGKLERMMKFYGDERGPEARAIADEVLANESANAFERAYAAQIAAQVAYDAGDTATAVDYFDQAIELDGLDNNAHYNVMLNLAQLQQVAGQPAESLATYERFFKETQSQQPQHLMMKGQALLMMKQYQEAAATMKQAIAASSEPKPEWQALLMQAYAEGGQGSEAVQIAEKVASGKPDDKRAQMNLAVVYQQAGMTDKATAVLEKLRTSGQLTEASEYQQLYATYINLEGQEKRAVEVIEDGLQKGVLKPDFTTYVALAQANYFSGQSDAAVEAYRKAAPLDKTGETYLNLAKVLANEGRLQEAKAAAQEALSKGVAKPAQAEAIIAR